MVSVDNRGTPAPRGRAWRKAIYKKIGVVTSADQAAAARTIARGGRWVDSTRIARLGLERRRLDDAEPHVPLSRPLPDRHGGGAGARPAALRHDLPGALHGAAAGQRGGATATGSPLTFADRLQGNLLLVHGSGDDNVHYQGTERLVNALVAANRPFTLMVYPNRTHCICEGEGTTLHLFSLLTRYLEDHVPPGGR